MLKFWQNSDKYGHKIFRFSLYPQNALITKQAGEHKTFTKVQFLKRPQGLHFPIYLPLVALGQKTL